MMKFYTVSLFFSWAACSIDVSAQTLNVKSDTLVWEIDNLTDVPNDTTMTYQCQFVTYGDERIIWTQQDGAYSNEFLVSSSSGRWTDVSKSGSIEYTVKYLDRKGKVTFSRMEDQYLVSLNFMEGDSNTMPFVMHVKSVSKKIP